MNANANSPGLTAVFMMVPEGYVAFIKELPGANTHVDRMLAAFPEKLATVLFEVTD